MNTEGIDVGPPSPAPAPAPAPPTTPAVTPTKGVAGAAGWLAAVAMAGVLLWPHLPALPHFGPAPAPAPAPKADGYLGPLWGVYVVPDPPTLAQAALQTDPEVRKASEAASVEWRCYLASASAVKENAWDDDVTKAGGPPCVLWIKGSGSLAAVTRAPDAAKVVADLRAIRGVK